MRRMKELLTASDVARLCHVDLKTIHNWVERGEIQHFRTPGRHLRFRRADVVEFLRRFGYPIPSDLESGPPRLALLERDPDTTRLFEHNLTGTYHVTSYADPYDGLLEIGADRPEIVLVGSLPSNCDSDELVDALHRSVDRYGGRVVRLGSSPPGPAAGSRDGSTDADRLLRSMCEALGLEPPRPPTSR